MTKYFEYIQPNIDKFGVIANLNNDEGDSSNREGTFALLINELHLQGKVSEIDYNILRTRYGDVIKQLYCGKGSLRRGPDLSAWTGQTDVMSRDQWVPNAIATGGMGLPALNALFFGHLLRGLLFATNTCPDEYITGQPGGAWKLPDITVMSSWGIYIRSYVAWPLWPLLLVFDLELLVNSMIVVWQSHYDPTETDVINHLNKLIQAYRYLPTPVSWLSAKLLKYDARGMQACLNDYFSPLLNEPALSKVYADVLVEVLK